MRINYEKECKRGFYIIQFEEKLYQKLKLKRGFFTNTFT